MDSILLDLDEKPCDTNTKYESVIISEIAKVIRDISEKKMVLEKIVNKYTPDLTKKISNNMINSTAVVIIDVKDIQGNITDKMALKLQ